jgi:hypothetical protein
MRVVPFAPETPSLDLSRPGAILIMAEKDITMTADAMPTRAELAAPRQTSQADIQPASRKPSVAVEAQPKAKAEQLENATGWESDNLIYDLEKELERVGDKKGPFHMEFKNPKHFTWILVAFASMGGLLSGLDQSLISGANLTLPRDLHLSPQQLSLVNSGMPLGGK